jgi:anti-sigma regulatory factor (Ser/Thr protein kinase)
MAARLLRQAVEHVGPLPHIPETICVVRQRARAALAHWNLSPDTDEDALLVISELLTNAILHALPPAALRLSEIRVDECSARRIEVTDAGPAVPAAASIPEIDPDEHGRGVGIVTALSARCGMRIHSGGTTRWADLLTG